ncbi:MAG: PAS domain S-box protein, partial [Candidatus Thorarchaeota archaeon]
MENLKLEESGINKKEIIRVLHIDDEEDFLIITKDFVEKLSDGEISVVSISNPLEALERIETREFDVIVCDYMMEELNGLDLLRKLKTQKDDIPFIIFTGRGREEVVIKALNLGADYYIRKGLDAKSQYTELVHQINTVFRHKTAERDLRESEEKFSLFLDNFPAVAYLKDENGRYTFFNDYLYDVYKVTPDQIIGKTALEFFGQEAGEVIEKEDEIALKEGFWTSTGTRKIGDEEYTFKMYKFPIKREGKPTIIAGFSEDITQQRELERVLHESEARYRNLVESFNDIVFITDLDSRMLYTNPALQHQTGFTKDDFQFTQEENPFIHPDDAERVAKFIQNFIQSDDELSDIIENRFVDKEGRMHWYSSIITKISYEGNPALQYIVHNITKRKQLEEKLKSERDMSNLYLNEAGVIFAIVDENETTLQINKKLTEVLGYTEEDIIGRNWFEVLYPIELQDELKLSFQQVISGLSKPIEYIEIEMRTKDGDKRIIAWRNIALKDDSGKTIQILGTGEDITKRKEMERSLQEKEERYRTVVELSPDSIILADLKGNIIFANKSAADIHGVEKPEELIGASMIEFTAPEDHQRLIENLRRNFKETQFDQTMEYTMVRKDETHFPAELRASMVFDDQGKPFGLLVVERDISERKKFERDLLESEAKYRSFVENFHGIAFRGTVDFTAIFFHGAVEEITGYKEEDFTISGLKWDELILPEDLHITQSITKNLQTEPNFKSTLEYRIKRKDGEIRWIRQYISNISIEGENPFLVQGTLYDITKRKNAEYELKQSETLYRTIFESIGSANAIARDDTIVTLVNSKMEELSGYSKEEIEGKMSWTKFIPESELGRLRDFSKRRAEEPTSVPSSYESKFITKSGEIKNSLIHVEVIPGTKNVVVSVMDITELKTIEEELKKSENLYRTIFEATGTANVIIKQDTTILYINSRTEEMIKEGLIKEAENLKETEW